MKLLLLALSCFAARSALGLKGGWRVRFGLGDADSYGTKYYRDIPKDSASAVQQGWTNENRADTDVLPSLKMYCHSTKVICALYDPTGYAAGLQVAIPQDKFTESEYDVTVRGYIPWTPSDGNTYWAIQQYYVDEAYLATSEEDRIASRDPEKFLQASAIWVRGTRGELLRIGTTLDEIYAAGFTKQACFPLMGFHQYRNMTQYLPCSAETLYPFFTLTDNDELIGTGISIFGKIEETEGDWFERVPRCRAEVIVPRAPECLYDLADKPGIITVHMYYIEEPWTLTCPCLNDSLCLY